MKNSFRVLLSTALIASGLTFAFVSKTETKVEAAKTARANKFGVCHRTNAIKNPYRYITVAFSSVNRDLGGHDNPVHEGPVFNVADPLGSHGTVPRDSGLGTEAGGSNNRWGDIFYAEKNAGQWNANNWFVNDADKSSAANVNGQAIFNGAINTLTGKAACRRITVADYIRSEIEAQRDNPGLGITMKKVMEELDEMEASEDFAVKKSLGGSFEDWYDNNGNGSQDPSIINKAIETLSPGVTTEPPNAVSMPGASLNGTVSPKGEPMTYYFEFSTDPTFPDASTTETTKLDSSSAEVVTLTFPQTGLTAGVTYYYRTVGVVTNGLTGDDLLETVLFGVIEQFNSDSPAAPTGVAAVCANQSLTITFTASATSGVDKYQYSLDGADWADAVLTGAVSDATNSFLIISLLNGTSYSVRIRAFETTGTIPGFSSVNVAGIPCGLPSVTTLPATTVANTSATLNGIATSNGATTTVTFEYLPLGSAANCAALDFSTATTVNVTSTLSSDSIDAVQTFTLTGLTPQTTYCYRVKGVNTPGSDTGEFEQFTTTSETTTAAAPDAPAAPAAPAATIRGALKGVVWIDQNRNGKQDSNEPGLPFTPIVAEVSTAPVSSQSLNKTGVAASRVRKFAINATTDANGFYDVPSLDPGRWTVTATLQTSALEKTFDSTNGTTTNWFASAVVPVNGVGEADFAAAGNAQVALDVLPTAECTKTNTVEVQWAGIDTKMNTTDDVVFLATVKNQESLVRGLPWGSYLVTPICSDGTRLAPQPLVITKAQANAKTVSKMSVQLAKVDSPLLKKILPATGQTNGATSTALSMFLILAGLATLMAPRRRRESANK